MIAIADRPTEELHDPITARDVEIVSMKKIIEQQRERIKQLEVSSRKWDGVMSHKSDLLTWLVDQATRNGKFQSGATVDAAISDEDVIPCNFKGEVDGIPVRCELLSTVYTVTRDE